MNPRAYLGHESEGLSDANQDSYSGKKLGFPPRTIPYLGPDLRLWALLVLQKWAAVAPSYCSTSWAPSSGTLSMKTFLLSLAIRPALYRISMKELLMIKHPTAWIEFEKGLISEEELNVKFFKDKRGFDSSGLKACMANGYAYLEGVEALLGRLKSRGYRMHAFTNYPSWYELIEEKLELSKYLSWTFVSCHTGKRKPDPDAFVEAAKQLGLSPSDVIFIDDQSMNVEAAIQIGMTGLTFQGAKELERDLLALGVLL